MNVPVVPITSAVAMPVPLTILAIIVKLKEFLDKRQGTKDEEAAVSLTYQVGETFALLGTVL
jgi:hypothetical protein